MLVPVVLSGFGGAAVDELMSVQMVVVSCRLLPTSSTNEMKQNKAIVLIIRIYIDPDTRLPYRSYCNL